MSFFIRNKNSAVSGPKSKRKKQPLNDKKGKSKQPKTERKSSVKHNDEVTSSEDEDEASSNQVQDFVEEDEYETTQERKLKLAKKYLDQVVEEERERQQVDEVGTDVLVSRLRDDVLEQAGKLWKSVADKIKTDFNTSDVTVLRCKDHKLSLTCVVVSSNGRDVFTGSKDGSVVKWSLETKTKVKCIPPRYKDKGNTTLHSSPILSLAVSHDNKYLASGDESNVIRIWNPESLAHVHSFSGHRGPVTGLAFCRFTPHLYSCSRDKTVKVWSMVEMMYIETLFGHQNPVTGLDVLGKNRAVTSGGTDQTCRVWKIDEESQLIFNGQTRSIDCVKRINDQHFVSCGDDGDVCIWGIFKKKSLCIVRPSHGVDSSQEPNWVNSLATVPNSEVFASGSSDGVIRLWKCDKNFRSVTELATVPVNGFINSLAFTPDYSTLVAAVGQEHRLGRWSTIKEAKNSLVIINVKSTQL